MPSHGLILATGNETVLEERFLAKCLLHDFEISLATAVMTGSTCVVQCYNNKSNHRSPASGLAMERHKQCEFQPERHFDHFTDRFFMLQDPRVRSFIAHSNYMEKRTGKKHYLREQDERYLIL